jgi:hypothetical protein
MFASMNVCRGGRLSRRDDIESLMYLTLYMLNKNQLPWSQFQKKLSKDQLTINQIR